MMAQARSIKGLTNLLIVLWVFLTVTILWPVISDLANAPANQKVPEPNGANYLVIAPQALENSASAWADYRRSTGYQVEAVLLSSGQVTVERIRDLIQKRYIQSGKPYPFYVLLIGHAHPHSSYPASYLPAAYFSVDPDQFSGYGTEPIPSDDGYTGNFSGGMPRKIPPIFIGRIPARTDAEVYQILERTRRYEETPPVGAGRARIELVTSDAGFGAQYDPLFEWALRTLIQKALPDEYQWHILSGNPNSLYSYPIPSFHKEVARRFDSGALAVVYIGHAQPDLLGWAYSPNGARDRIFRATDAPLVQNAHASLGIFTACSAGQYDLAGDDLSVVEAVFLTPGGPVATYASSAWINAILNGRLLIDIFEALLVDHAATVGEWAGQVEAGPLTTGNHVLLTAILKSLLPGVSGIYEQKLILSPAQAGQVLDIQHASYNLFGDPALRIAYPQPGMEVRPDRLWSPRQATLAFHGKSALPGGQPVSVFLEALPGAAIAPQDHLPGQKERYQQANDPVIGMVKVYPERGGIFSGRLSVPPNTSSGTYLLRAVSSGDKFIYTEANPAIIGGLPITEILSCGFFWWCVISMIALLGCLSRPDLP